MGRGLCRGYPWWTIRSAEQSRHVRNRRRWGRLGLGRGRRLVLGQAVRLRQALALEADRLAITARGGKRGAEVRRRFHIAERPHHEAQLRRLRAAVLAHDDERV